MTQLYLASASQRRREILAHIGLTFEVCPADADETVREALAPGDYVEVLAARKLSAAAGKLAASGRDGIVIAADTVVAADGAILGKPTSPEDARRMLAMLSGRKHEVCTGLAVCGIAAGKVGETHVTHETTAVSFRALSEEEIGRYVATGEPMDKAGAYGIQDRGGLFVTGIEGDYYNVVGLPLCRLGMLLREYYGLSLLR